MPQIFENSYVIQKCLEKKYETTCFKFHIHFYFSLKNELKIFLPTKSYAKGGPTFKGLLLEHTTLIQNSVTLVNFVPDAIPYD